MLIDTHSHVNFNAYREDSDEVTKRALAENIWMINVGSQESTSRRAIKMAHEYPKGVFAVVGMHPLHLAKGHVDEEEFEGESRAEVFDFDKYFEMASDKKVIGIGEVGLDFYRIEGLSRLRRPPDQLPKAIDLEEAKKAQTELFWQQIELATKINKPLVVHCRKAHPETIKILNEAMLKYDNIRGVIHSFSGRWSQAEEYLKMGFYIALNGIITYDRSYDKVALNIPLDKLLLETDCPYLTPEPHRGERNEPLFVKVVAQKIAEIKKMPFEKVAEITTSVAKDLFKL